ncbi:DUF2000 domain-containing protein [Dyadobacter sp. CY261]|uniref:DUF2000 domain-containing protein n=1 Tax=Dyadobacter sp. CY261 TaxID=2907203 RepID=UPI001F1CB715|nr:DUF2000 domain-containing protein [Dyadobacter sp. CY261]MCF0075554.1 DUF2000 domain-containing protein [Dyadobacter sp. CY261]
MYEHKMAVVILSDLLDWQKLNVTAFLASSVAIALPQTHGAPLVSASGTAYLPFLKHPILIYEAETGEQLRRAFNRASDRGLSIGIYTRELFTTKNENENVVEIAKFSDTALNLVGIILYGASKEVDKATDKLRFHR